MHRSAMHLSILAGLALSLAAAPALAGEPAPWRAVDAATGQIASVEELEQLKQDFPDSGSVRLRLLNALLEAGDAAGAGREAIALVERGYAFSQAAEGQLYGLMSDEDAEGVSARLAENRQPLETSAVLAAVPEEAMLVESAARDPRTGYLYATTVVSKALWVQRGVEGWSRIDIENAGSLSGIVFDEASGLFWIASGILDETPEPHPYSAVIAYDPIADKVVRRLYANGMVALGDVMVDGEGIVYVADPLSGTIHQAYPSDDGLRAFVGPGVFRSPQGMARFPGSDLVIVSDYRYGLAAVDAKTGKVWRFGARTPVLLDGIDGLWRHGDRLIAVQNGARPMRIVALTLSDDRLTVEDIEVLERDHPGWTEPVGGSIAGDSLIYVATGQWDRFAPGGTVREGAELMPTQLRILPLGEDLAKTP